MSQPVADPQSCEKQRSSLTKNSTNLVNENLERWNTDEKQGTNIYHPRRGFTNSKEKTSHKIETQAKGESQVTEEGLANDHQTDALMFKVTSRWGNSN